MTKHDVEKWAKDNTDYNFNGLKKGRNWNGYEVWEEVYGEDVCVGYPLVILVKGDKIRESTPEESLGYLDFSEGLSAEDEQA